MDERLPEIKSKNEDRLTESLILQLEELIIMPPGDHLSGAPGEFVKLNKEQKAQALKEVLGGLRDNIEYLSRYSTDESLLPPIKYKKMQIITKALEAKLLAPKDVAEFLE